MSFLTITKDTLQDIEKNLCNFRFALLKPVIELENFRSGSNFKDELQDIHGFFYRNQFRFSFAKCSILIEKASQHLKELLEYKGTCSSHGLLFEDSAIQNLIKREKWCRPKGEFYNLLDFYELICHIHAFECLDEDSKDPDFVCKKVSERLKELEFSESCRNLAELLILETEGTFLEVLKTLADFDSLAFLENASPIWKINKYIGEDFLSIQIDDQLSRMILNSF